MNLEDGLKDFGKVTRDLLESAISKYRQTGKDTLFPKRFPQSAKITWFWIKKYIDLNKAYTQQVAKNVDENCISNDKSAKIVDENCICKIEESSSSFPKEKEKKEHSSPTPLLYRNKKEKEITSSCCCYLDNENQNSKTTTMATTNNNHHHFVEREEKETKFQKIHNKEVQEAMDYWNLKVGHILGPCTEVFSGARADLNFSLKEAGLDKIKKAIDILSVNTWYQGENKMQWKARFSWLVKISNLQKIFDRGYENKPQLSDREFRRRQQIAATKQDILRTLAGEEEEESPERRAVLEKLRKLQGTHYMI